MNRLLCLALTCFFVCVAALEVMAAEPPLMAKREKLLFEDDFDRPDMMPKWKVGVGFWSVKDGVVTGAENPDDHHGAYAFITPNVEYKDIVAEFSFKMEGATDLVLNMRDSNYKGAQAGHILRATIMPKLIQVVDMKLGGMKWEYYRIRTNPKADPAEKQAVAEKIKDKTANFKANYDLAMWHEARVEVVGDEMLVSIDEKPVAYIKSEGIAHPTKNMIGFSIVRKSASIKNPKFWAATPQPEWESRREAIVGNLPK